MSTGYLISLGVVVAVIVGARLLFAGLPLRGLAMPVTVTDAVLVGIGAAGLAFHCGAMFFRSLVSGLPGTHTVTGAIAALGGFSIVWYVGAAGLLLLGLRHQRLIALAVVVLALAAVGITMYDGGSLHAHLTAIFFSVVVLTGVAALLVLPPRRRSPAVRYP